MAHIHRLVFTAVALLLSASSAVYAQTCTGQYSIGHAVSGATVYSSTAAGACSAAGGQDGTITYSGSVVAGGGGCDFRITDSGTYSGLVTAPFLSVPSCTGGGGSSGVNNCKSGASAGRWQVPVASGQSYGAARYLCDGESPSGNSDGSVCVVKVEPTLGAGGFAYGDGVFTGAASKMSECTGTGGTGGTADDPLSGNRTPPVEGEPAPTPCKAGEAPGSVNGITKCYPAGSTGQPVTTTDDKRTTTTPPAGGASAPTAPNDAGNIGAPQCVGTQCTTSTKSETTCIGDKCTTTATTTTTTTDANGNTTTKTGSTTTTGSKGGFCAENPNSEQCKTGSFGGSCSAAFSCDGDAVMCAIALDQHKRNCTLFETPSAESSLYDAEKNKEGSQATDEAKSIGSGSFDTTDAIGGGSGCITDKAVTVMGKTFMVPFSSVCPSLALIGNVMLVVSFLLAGRIVVRG